MLAFLASIVSRFVDDPILSPTLFWTHSIHLGPVPS